MGPLALVILGGTLFVAVGLSAIASALHHIARAIEEFGGSEEDEE